MSESGSTLRRCFRLSFCLLCRGFDDAKVWRFLAPSNKKEDSRLRSTRRIYEICGRNGKPCHNCRKIRESILSGLK